MKKAILTVLVAFLAVFALTGCWYGEIGVETVFDEKDGGGTRTFILDVMDDSLSATPIPNPDDPEGTEGKGAVLNDVQIDGGVEAIQDWFEDNAPTFLTVEAMETVGYHRYFKLSFAFADFDEFLEKYGQLVDLSPTMDWADFTDAEKPTWVCDGAACTFTEAKATLDASLDWAIDGIWNDIYVEGGLAGFVTKADISVLANVTVTINDVEGFAELQHFDEDAVDGAGTGAMVYVESASFAATGEFLMNPYAIGGIVAGALAVIGGAVWFFLLRKKPV